MKDIEDGKLGNESLKLYREIEVKFIFKIYLGMPLYKYVYVFMIFFHLLGCHYLYFNVRKMLP